MNNRPIFLLSLAALALITGTISAQDAEQSRGAQILAGYKYDLRAALREGLSESPVDAIAACQTQAPQITEALSQDGIRVGRASHRLRNPANVGPEWVQPILEAYIANPADRAPRTVSLSAGKSGYAEAIVLQPLCTTCHGEAIPADVANRINELYPDDRAVGFKPGELRGVFWVEYPATK